MTTVAILESLSTLDWTVEAWESPNPAMEMCDHDTDHGSGTVCVGSDVLCPECAVGVLRVLLEVGSRVEVHVLNPPCGYTELELL